MNYPHMTRVVHFPCDANDLGVVGRCDGSWVVFWHTGEIDPLEDVEQGNGPRRGSYDSRPRWLPTVSRSRLEMRAIYDLHAAAEDTP